MCGLDIDIQLLIVTYHVLVAMTCDRWAQCELYWQRPMDSFTGIDCTASAFTEGSFNQLFLLSQPKPNGHTCQSSFISRYPVDRHFQTASEVAMLSYNYLSAQVNVMAYGTSADNKLGLEW